MSRPFWDALREHRILIQYSPSLGKYVFYPRTLAPGTLADDLQWREIDGAGTLYTFTVARRPTGPPWADKVPQLLAVVEWDVGPRVSTELVDVEPGRHPDRHAGVPGVLRHRRRHAAAVSGLPMFETVQQLLRSRMADDTVAVMHGDRTWTWREHLNEASAEASVLTARCLLTPPGRCTSARCWAIRPAMLRSMAAAALGGYVLCGINTTRRGEGLAADIRRSDCQARAR